MALPAHDALALIDQERAIRAEQRRREAARSQSRLQEAIEAARAGDPMPFLSLQWGRVLTADQVVEQPTLPAQLRAKGERYLILDTFQEDILRSMFAPGIREVYVKGNTGCGKGGAAGLAICTYFAVWPDALVVVSRDSAERAVDVMIGEVGRWFKRMLLPPPGCVLQAAGLVDLAERTHEVRVVNPDTTEGFTGAHAPHVLVVFDEATAAPLEKFYSLVPTMAHKFLAIANPRTSGGAFWSAFNDAVDPDQVDVTQTVATQQGLRRLITVDGDQILNVRLGCLKHPVGPPGGLEIDGRHYEPGEPLTEEHAKARAAVVPGQTCYDEHLAICANPDPDHVACYGHGRFPRDDKELAIVLRRWLTGPVDAWTRFDRAWQRAKDRPHVRARLRRYWPIRAFGLDVGAGGNDPAILTAGGERGIWRQFEGRYGDSMALCRWVLEIAQDQCGVNLRDGGIPVGIDVIGVGWGVAGALRNEGVRVIDIRGNDPAIVDKRRYTNMRAEAYGELGRRLDMDGRWTYQLAPRNAPGLERKRALRKAMAQIFALPPDERLFQELRATEKVFGTDGMRFAATPKRRLPGMKREVVTVEDRIKRSPDRADSATYFHRALQWGSVGLEEALDAGFF